jgi:uncharacterized membrane protein YidH (DUF202 family)
MTVLPRPPRDPGLQGERTALAWGRTALAVFVNALLVVRAGVVESAPILTVCGLALVAVAVLVAGFGHLRSRELIRHHETRDARRRILTVFAVALIATALSVASIALT